MGAGCVVGCWAQRMIRMEAERPGAEAPRRPRWWGGARAREDSRPVLRVCLQPAALRLWSAFTRSSSEGEGWLETRWDSMHRAATTPQGSEWPCPRHAPQSNHPLLGTLDSSCHTARGIWGSAPGGEVTTRQRVGVGSIFQNLLFLGCLFYQSSRGELKVPLMMVNLNTVPFSSTQFCFMRMEATLLGAVHKGAITAACDALKGWLTG